METKHGPGSGILELARHLANTDTCIAYLRSMGLLQTEKLCKCGEMMHLKPKKDISDGETWRCPNCQSRISIRHSSIFAGSTLNNKLH